jgi:hypothetical protein
MKMKTTSIALAALLVAGSVAAPAFAAESTIDFDSQLTVMKLQNRGVNAVAAYEGAPDQIRAVVELADGTQVFQYFDETTLRPITHGVAQTRVLSDLDVTR